MVWEDLSNFRNRPITTETIRTCGYEGDEIGGKREIEEARSKRHRRPVFDGRFRLFSRLGNAQDWRQPQQADAEVIRQKR